GLIMSPSPRAACPCMFRRQHGRNGYFDRHVRVNLRNSETYCQEIFLTREKLAITGFRHRRWHGILAALSPMRGLAITEAWPACTPPRRDARWGCYSERHRALSKLTKRGSPDAIRVSCSRERDTRMSGFAEYERFDAL